MIALRPVYTNNDFTVVRQNVVVMRQNFRIRKAICAIQPKFCVSCKQAFTQKNIIFNEGLLLCTQPSIL
jgi:hypothetical protein